MAEADRYIVISTDGHCGAALRDYKPYLESKFHDEFDSWASSYKDAWEAIDEATATDHRIGVSSFMSPYNWDSSLRQRELDRQGIAAEVLFPNTVPPFQPSGAITAPGPTTAGEYERRFAGLRAHNRWLADFCAEEPGRRAGIAQIFLDDVDAAIEEVRWAKEHGLMGVLLPSDHYLKIANLYYPAYSPFWEACVDLDLPVHRHGILPAEAASEQAGVAAPAVGFFESFTFAVRGIAQVVLAGVFEQFPTLKFVLTETTSSWIGQYMESLDQFSAQAKVPKTAANMFAGAAFEKLSMKPSEYVKRNCYIGSFLTAMDIEKRHDLGVHRVMWGADFPHHEGTGSFTREALRLNFAGMPTEEVRQMTSLTAAECYGFDIGRLQKVADRIGPSELEIQTPLLPEELPKYPDVTQCLTFVPPEDWYLF